MVQVLYQNSYRKVPKNEWVQVDPPVHKMLWEWNYRMHLSVKAYKLVWYDLAFFFCWNWGFMKRRKYFLISKSYGYGSYRVRVWQGGSFVSKRCAHSPTCLCLFSGGCTPSGAPPHTHTPFIAYFLTVLFCKQADRQPGVSYSWQGQVKIIRKSMD